MPWPLAIGNRLVLRDVQRAVRRDALARLDLCTTGFDFVVELAAQAARAGLTLGEVPVHYSPRQLGTSKMRHLPELGHFAGRALRLSLAA